MIKRIAAVLGIVTFLVLAGTTASVAYWSTQASTHSTVAATDLNAVNCTAPVKLVNGGFESPSITGGISNQNSIPGWLLDATSSTPQFELWTGWDGATPAVGSQLLELNGNGPDIAYQELTVTPGQVLQWSLMHRGRWGDDTMYVAIDPAGSTSYTYQTPTGAGTTSITTGTAGWVRYSGSYVVPATQAPGTKTRFALVPGPATSTRPGESVTNGSVGNLVDDISFGSGPCLVAESTISNASAYYAGQTVTYTTTIRNDGGAPAQAGVFTATVPAGLDYLASSITVGGVAQSDTAGNDLAEYDANTRTITARLGLGATATAGGLIATDNSTIVTFRGVIRPDAGGGTLSYASSTSYLDPLAPTWPLSAVSPTLTTNVGIAPDLVMTVASESITNSPSRSVSWEFTLTNAGAAAAASTQLSLSMTSSPSTRLSTAGTLQYNTGTGWQNCGTAATGTGSTTTISKTCAIGTLAPSASVAIRLAGTPTATAANGTTFTGQASASTTSTEPVTTNNSASSVLALDTTAPNAPTSLAATRASQSQIDLTWSASTSSDVTAYRIYRNGTEIALVPGTSYADAGLPANALYWYWVVAVDAQGNISTNTASTTGAAAGSGAATYVTGTTNVRIDYPNATNRCIAASGTGNGADVEIRTNCTSTAAANVQWGFTELAARNTVEIQLGTATDRKWTGGGTGDINLGNVGGAASARWVLDVQWSGSAPYLRLKNSDGRCAQGTTNATNGNNLTQATCGTDARQRYTLGAW